MWSSTQSIASSIGGLSLACPKRIGHDVRHALHLAIVCCSILTCKG